MTEYRLHPNFFTMDTEQRARILQQMPPEKRDLVMRLYVEAARRGTEKSEDDIGDIENLGTLLYNTLDLRKQIL